MASRFASALMFFVMAAALLAGCGEDNVTYRGPDGSTWGPGCDRWDAPDGGAAWVSNSLMNSVSVLDLGARSVTGTHPVGVTPLVENGPHHLDLDLAEGAYFAPLSFPAPSIAPGPHAAHGSASTPGVLIKRSLCDHRLLGRADLDPNPGDLLLSPDRRRAYVSHYDLRRALENTARPEAQRSTVIIVDTRTMTRVATVPVCVAAHGMALSPDGRTLYTTCYGDDALAVVDVAATPPTVRLVYLSGSPPSSVTSPTHGPYSISISPDGSAVWIGCAVSGALIAYDTAAGRIDETRVSRRLGGKPFFPAFSPDGSTMIMPTQGRDGLLRIRTAAPLDIVQNVPLSADECTLPHQVNRGPDGMYYLVCEGRHAATPPQPGTILALDPDSLRVVHRYTVGVYPDAIVFARRQR